jgi:hypothetical protein
VPVAGANAEGAHVRRLATIFGLLAAYCWWEARQKQKSARRARSEAAQAEQARFRRFVGAALQSGEAGPDLAERFRRAQR